MNLNPTDPLVLFQLPSVSPEPSKALRKRKSNIRACDACSIRKVKCELNRPCSHCVANKLNCTQLRERKKSGPKNLQKKTLDSINSLSEVIDINQINPKKRSVISTNSAYNTDDDIDTTEFDNVKSYPLNTFNLIENINLIVQEPIVFELLKPLTVQSSLINCHEFLEFLQTNFPDSHADISLVEHHNNSILLSKLLIILTINLIIVEILIKLKKQKYKDFIKYPKKYILFRNFKNFKNLCHFKCIEIFTLIEKNFIVPPVIPINNAKNLNNINLNQINQYQIYYNLSLSCLNLCNYYHILNLTNTLNTDSKGHNNDYSTVETNYGNEAQEHQKIINLNKAITYYQLINIKSPDNSTTIQLYELFEILFTYERYYLVYSSNNYNLNLVRNNELSIQMNSLKMLHNKSVNIDNKFNSNILFELLNIINDFNEIDGKLFNNLVRSTSFNVNLSPDNVTPTSNSLRPHPLNRQLSFGSTPDSLISSTAQQAGSSSTISTYLAIKSRILNISNQDNILEVVKQILLFKLLLIIPLPRWQCMVELKGILMALNLNLLNNSDLFKIQMSNYQSLPHLLHLLKVILEAGECDDEMQTLLVKFSDHVINHFPFFNNINKLIRSNDTLNDWFLHLNENRVKVAEANHTKVNSKNSSYSNISMTTMSQVIPNQGYLVLDNFDGQHMSSNNSVIHEYKKADFYTPSTNEVVEPINDQQSSGFSSSASLNEIPPMQQQNNSNILTGNGAFNPLTAEIPNNPDGTSDLEQLTMSESTKNLYNLFNQISEDFGTNGGIFQMNPQFLDRKHHESDKK